MQPYPTIQNYGYGSNPYGYQQPMVPPYQDRMVQLQQQMAQYAPAPQQQAVQMPYLAGQMVDGIDAVKAKDVDLSGNPTWYPKADGTEVYRKQLQPDGTSQITVYRAVQPSTESKHIEKDSVSVEMLNGMFEQLEQNLMEEISGIKKMLPTQMSEISEPPKVQRGGNQK